MKNVHILPTDKPSRFFLNKVNGKLLLDSDTYCNLIKILPSGNYQNIYITSDEEIKEGDYSFYPPFGVGKNIVINGELCFHIEAKDGKGSFNQRTYQTLDENKKIILTTDQDLIKNGVQSIDDEFLEWFVKNPSCEEVEIFNAVGYTQTLYFIVIPKEEPKQETNLKKHLNSCQEYQGPRRSAVVDKSKYISGIDPYDKQETLEEAAENKYGLNDKYWKDRIGFVHGAKWQAERMLKFILDEDNHTEGELGNSCIDVQTLVYFIEQFKKK